MPTILTSHGSPNLVLWISKLTPCLLIQRQHSPILANPCPAEGQLTLPLQIFRHSVNTSPILAEHLTISSQRLALWMARCMRTRIHCDYGTARSQDFHRCLCSSTPHSLAPRLIEPAQSIELVCGYWPIPVPPQTASTQALIIQNLTPSQSRIPSPRPNTNELEEESMNTPPILSLRGGDPTQQSSDKASV